MPTIRDIDYEDWCCADCGQPADVFTGLADPDATQTPRCHACADRWFTVLLMDLAELRYENEWGK